MSDWVGTRRSAAPHAALERADPSMFASSPHQTLPACIFHPSSNVDQTVTLQANHTLFARWHRPFKMAQDAQKPSADMRLHDSLSLLRDVDLREVMDREQELEFRMRLVRSFRFEYDIRRNPRDLYAAIEHAEVAVRLAASPRDKVNMLNSLSWLKMSAFYLDESASRLNEAIDYARLAHTELEAGPENDKELIKAYENLGHALSAKSQLESDLQALDEAIDCAREVVRLAEDEEIKASTSGNLAIRLHLWYRKSRQECDAAEALSILAKSLEILRPGSAGYAGALLAQGDICSDMYKHNGDLETLDQAIANFEQALGSDPAVDERRVDLLRKLSHLYESKHQKTADLSALRSAAKYFGMAITDAAGHPRKIDFISAQLNLLGRLAKAEQSLPGIEATLDQAWSLFSQIPSQHAKWNDSSQYISFIMADRYILTRDPAHLKALVGHVMETGKIWNDERGWTGSRVELTPAEALQSCLDALAPKKPSGATVTAVDKICSYFRTAYKASGPTQAVLNLYREHGPALEQLCRPHVGRASPPVGESIARVAGAEMATPKKDLSICRRPLEDSGQFEDRYRDPLTGLRYLAPSASGRLIMTVEPIVRDVMGYKVGDPVPQTLAEGLAREARLEAEALQRERDERKNPNPALCRVCRRLEVLKRQEDGTISWNPELWLPWGTWDQLRGRSHCVICRLLLSLLATSSRGNEQALHPRLARIDPDIQGTQLELQMLDTGELVLGVLYGLVVVGSLRIVTEANRQDAIRADDGEALLSKVQSWLQTCEVDHGPRCCTFLGEKRCASPIPLLFVDVVDHCLVSATSAEKYFALSYVWGGPQTTATTRSNVEERYQSGTLADGRCALPWTIRDAMVLVRRMGGRYLWVDSLCIVQDDAEHKHRDIQRMDIVYMMAFATIVAAHGENADAGLPGVRPGTRNAQITGSVFIPASSSASSDSQTLLLTTAASPLPLALESSVWESRGWVLQERLLSRRCIYFTSDWTYFQCGRKTVSETASDGPVSARRLRDPREANDFLSMENPLVLLGKVGLISERERLCRAFEVYTKLVGMYVLRDLTVYHDIVNAFSGILSVLEEHFAGGFVSALPVAVLDLALLWTPGQKMLVRTHYANPKKTDSPQPYFPSWSWTGWVPWVGRPTYHHIFANMQSQPLPEPVVNAFRLHHHGTLHTIRARSSTCVLEPATRQTGVLGPDFGPEVLQFWADTVEAAAFHFATIDKNRVEPEQLSSRENVHAKTSQAVIRLRDREERHCGLWYDNKNHRLWWAAEDKEKKPRAELVAISRLTAPESNGPFRVEGEIDIFDRGHFPSVGAERGVVNCLVIEWYEEIAARVTVAQVHWAAWQRAGPRRKHIRLV
ncbi:hypothetical protein VTI74DRAFT_6337 [Chaetomium olivicolor]